jgi:uncharacterized membrane protein
MVACIMSDFEIADEYLETIDAQFKQWAAFLNNAIGLVSFTLAIACLGTNSPSINATLSLLVITLIRIDGGKFFPKEIQKLRSRAKTDEKVKIILEGLESKYFGFKTNFKDYALFVLGFALLIFVALSNWLTGSIPILSEYIGF